MAAGAPQTRSAAVQKTAEQIELILTKKIMGDQLVLPATADTAARCRALLRNVEVSITEAGALVGSDPLLAVQLMKSTSRVGPAPPMMSTQEALTKMGSQRLKAWVMEVATRTVYESRDARIAQSLRRLWEHSVAVAIVSRDLATMINSSDPELAYLGGLLHDIGKPVVATVLLEAERAATAARPTAQFIEPEAWLEIVDHVHRKVGVLLMEKWRLAEPLCEAVRECAEYDSADRLSIPNTVRFSNAVVKRHGICTGSPDLDEVNAQILIGRSVLRISEAMIARVTQTLTDEVRQALKPPA